MNPNQELWEKGDFTKIADGIRESEASIIDKLHISSGMRVLDLACGDGNTAIPAARRGAEVLGVDIARNLVAAAKERAAAAGLSNCRFQEGDASHLDGIQDAYFDMVVTIFGAMFAPKPFDVAKEMVRVTKPGGKIIMGNWIPGDPTIVAQTLRISAAYTPPPPEGFVSPMLWGVEQNVRERFTAAGVPESQISCKKDMVQMKFKDEPAAFLQLFKNYYGPTMNAFVAAEKAGKVEALDKELTELFNSQSKPSPEFKTNITANFLLVEVTR